MLEDPELHLDARQLAHLKRIQPKLAALESRVVGDPTFDLTKTWGTFGKQEIAMTNRLQSELVRPGGSPQAALGARWNWPSYSSEKIHNAHVIDDTNPCIKMLINKGFTEKNTFMYEDYYRREKRGGRDLQPKAVRDLHKSLTNTINDAMSAKVEIVLGKDNRDYYQKIYSGRMEELPLWSLPLEISLYIIYNSTPGDRAAPTIVGAKTSIIRLVVFVHHTEHFFKNWSMSRSKEVDLKCNVAADLACIGGIKRNWFQDRIAKYALKLGRALVQPEPQPLKRKRGAEVKQITGTKKLKLLGVPKSADTNSPDNIDPSGLSQAIGFALYDNDLDDETQDVELQGDRPASAIAEAKSNTLEGYSFTWGDVFETMADGVLLEKSGSTFSWENFPEGLKRWISEFYPDVVDLDSLVKRAKAEFNERKTGEGGNRHKREPVEGTWRCFQFLISRQAGLKSKAKNNGALQEMNRNAGIQRRAEKGGLNKLQHGANADKKPSELWVYHKGMLVVSTKCHSCGQEGPDNKKVRWWVTQPDVYVMYRAKCWSGQCKGGSRWMAPVDDAMLRIKADSKHIKRAALPGPDAPPGKKRVRRNADNVQPALVLGGSKG